MADTIVCLVVSVPDTEAELASDALWALGVLAVEERRGTEAGDPIVELWTSLGEDIGTVTQAAEAFPSRWRWRLVEVDRAVTDTWREHAGPTWVASDLVVVPAWKPFAAPANATVVTVDPGSAFGLGDHPTTVLTLREMRAALTPDCSMLDVGCGSGVLSIAACLLGASYVRAIDISPAAVSATRDNAERNGVAGSIEVDTTPLSAIEATFDVVVANVLAPALVEMSDDLVRVLGPSGVLVVSGVLEGRHDHVLDALAPLRVAHEASRDGWSAVSLRR